ncbi:MAG: hypothetical protein HOK80_03815, partial [Candidatus Cloacimonetes bacterium]|nr:hypothetical protein [Candidatus Cloacimonadota bacterium]
MRLAFIPVASDFLSDNELEKIVTSNYEKINKFCVNRIGKEDILEAKKIYYFIVTGG